jgi:Holliday junction resolvase
VESVSGGTSRSKGARGEVELVTLLRENGWPHARRNFGSGSSGGNDLVGGPADVAFECKRTERLRLHEAYAQLLAAARPTDLPVLAHRRNGGEWLATVPLDELLALLKLREMGA